MSICYKTIDLCAGIGGIRRGFEMVNQGTAFKNVLSAEIDKYACQAYEHIYGENPYHDITSEQFKQQVAELDYDILLAGFPCQAFSISGKKAGFADQTRGTVFFDIAQIIERTRPKAFLLENVEGLLFHDKGNTFQVIARTLDELGYVIIGVNKVIQTNTDSTSVYYQFNKADLVRNPYDFGIPQKRARVFLMGFLKQDLPTEFTLPSLPKTNHQTLYEDLNALLETKVDAKYYLSEQYVTTLKNHKHKHQSKNAGFGYIVVNDQDKPMANTIMATGGSGKERNLIRQYYAAYDGLDNVKGKKSKLNHEGLRYMTPQEWGKLQGFVNFAFMENGIDTFSLPANMSDSQAYKLFGNSVCIPIIKSLAEHMYEILTSLANYHTHTNKDHKYNS